MHLFRLDIGNGIEIDETVDTARSLWTNINYRVKLLHYHGSFWSLNDNLDSRRSFFVTHAHVTRQQRDYVKAIKLASHFTTFAAEQVNFVENFSFAVQKEIQSAYQNEKRASLYKILISIGMEHWNMVIISNRMIHDTTFVYRAQKLIVKFIQNEYPSFKN